MCALRPKPPLENSLPTTQRSNTLTNASYNMHCIDVPSLRMAGNQEI